MKIRKHFVSWILAAAVLATASTARASVLHRHDITGRITNTQGDVLVSAHVDITDQETGQTVSLLSDDQGHYLATGLVVDHHYTLRVRSIGYVAQTQKDVQVQDDAIAIDVALRPI